MNLATLSELSVELGLTVLPNQDQLPCDDGEPMETQRHKLQIDLLIEGLDTWLEQREDGYVGGNMFIYFSQAQLKNQDFKGPDFTDGS
jgi:Uma2 family endonuclease